MTAAKYILALVAVAVVTRFVTGGAGRFLRSDRPSTATSLEEMSPAARERAAAARQRIAEAVRQDSGFTIRASHPRVWITPERLARMKHAAEGNTDRWRVVKRAADAALANPDADSTALTALALTALVSGEERYCHRAAQILAAVAVPGNRLSGDHYYDYRFVLPDVTAGFDWCHAWLAPPLQKQVATWLMDRADEVWPDTNPSRADGWAVNAPSNNYWWGFLTTWPAALAAEGDDQGSSRGTSHTRARAHVLLGLRKWRETARPMLDTWGRGGVFAESTNYDAMISLPRILDAHRTATGRDLVNEPGFSFVHDSVLWRIHSTTPELNAVYPLGDQPRVSWGELSPYDRMRMLPALATIDDGERRALGRFWLQTITPSTTTWSWLAAWEFLYFEEDAKTLDYTKASRNAYFAEGPGILVGRSDWSRDATYFGIWAGPLRESHQSRDVNGFKIFKGGWLAGDGSIWSHSGIVSQTEFHNNISIAGHTQGEQVPSARWPDEAGAVLHVDSGDEYTYFAGQGAQAYTADRPHEGIRKVNDYRRSLFYLTGTDTFVIYDRIAPVESRPSTWHLHAKQRIRVDGRRFDFDNGAYRVWGETLLPQKLEAIAVVPVFEGPNREITSHRLDVTVGRSPVSYLLTVLQIQGAPAAAPPSPVYVSDRSSAMDGVAVNGWLVMAGRRREPLEQVSYRSPAGFVQHLLADLVPGHTYDIVSTDANGQTVRRVSATTSAAGTLRFDVQPNEVAFALTAGAPAAAAAIEPARIVK